MWIFSPAPLSPISTGLDAAVDGLLSAMERRRKVYRIPVKVFCMVVEGRPRSMAELGNMQCSPLKEGHKTGSLKGYVGGLVHSGHNAAEVGITASRVFARWLAA